MQVECKKLTLLCRGSNSEVYLYGTREKGVVLKTVGVNCTKESRHLSNEFKVLSSLEHENILKVLKYREKMRINGTGGSKQLEEDRNVLVVENARYGSLLDFYTRHSLSVNQGRWICAQLCEAVRYLHRNYIVHRDIKLENVLVGQNQSQIQIKLADFGFATSTHTSPLSSSYKGTERGYMAPEIHNLKHSPSSPSYNMQKTDIFALGVLMFSLVFGMLPFEYAKQDNPHYSQILKNNFTEFWRMHSKACERVQQKEGSLLQDFKTIFQLMVQPQPDKRPTIQEVLDCEWFSGKQEMITSAGIQGLSEGTATKTH